MDAQLALFEKEPEEQSQRQPARQAQPTLEWSYSRREVLEQCPRRFYYQYYGANSRVAKADSQKQSLRFLKTLSNRYMRVGEIVHMIIRTYLSRLKQGETWSLDRVLSWARDVYRKDLEHSRQYQPGDPPPSEKYPPILLLEFYYQFEDAEAVWTESENRLQKALTNFVESAALSDLRTGGSYAQSLVEKRVSVKRSHFTFRGQLDLAYPDQGRVVVADWKVGKSAGSEDSLQLLSYALGAIQEFQCTPDNIQLYRVHLVDNEVLQFSVDEEKIFCTQARIIQDVERLQAVDAYGRNAVAEAFTPCGQPRVCALCSFQEICPKE